MNIDSAGPDSARLYLCLDSWDFGDFFDTPNLVTLHPIVGLANQYQTEAQVEKHEFFTVAQHDKEALRIWAAQEAVVTNAFSQLLFHVCAQIKNVHIRTAFMPVISGEHHSLKSGVADYSHPWLLRRLCLSLGLEVESIKPLSFTVAFLDVLCKSTRNLYSALGALGVGNERMLIPEYTAVKSCFDVAYPEAEYEGFLNANISEDETHTRIIERVVSSLIRNDGDANHFYAGAIEGVDARLTYYDGLTRYVRRA